MKAKKPSRKAANPRRLVQNGKVSDSVQTAKDH